MESLVNVRKILVLAFSALLSAALPIFSLTPVNATTTETINCGTSGSFTIVDHVITSSTPTCSGGVVIPPDVTKIGNSAFLGRNGITSVMIPNSVTEIDDYAFNEAGGISTLVIPDSVTSIGASSFARAGNLESIVIGNSVTTIGFYAFSDLPKLRELILGDSIEVIDEGAFLIEERFFLADYGLIDLRIPDSVLEIKQGAFQGSKNLISLDIGNSVTSIGYGAFSGTSSLTNLTIGNSVTAIEDLAFFQSGLQSVVIPSSVNLIDRNAFESSRNLASVTFLGSAPVTAIDAFTDVANGAKAYVKRDASGFGPIGSVWRGLIVSEQSSTVSSSTPVVATPQAPQEPIADITIDLGNRNSIFKSAIKKQLVSHLGIVLSKRDRYSYQIQSSSKGACRATVTSIRFQKNSEFCSFNITRISKQGARQTYLVKLTRASQ